MRVVGGALLHLDQAAEGGVAGDDVHRASARVHDRGLDTVADHGVLAAEGAAEEEGEGRGTDGDGAGDVEAAGGGVETAGEGVDVDDVGEHGRGIRVGEFAPGCRGDPIPRVPVHVLLRVRADHRKNGGGDRLRLSKAGDGRPRLACTSFKRLTASTAV